MEEFSFNEEQFKAALVAHSKRRGDATNFPGDDYEDLFRFLTHTSRGRVRGVKDEPFAVLHNLAAEGNDHVSQYDGHSDLKSFRSASVPKESHILFLRGYPSPEWLQAVGSKFTIDPELFRRHLPRKTEKVGSHLPARLPSSSVNIIQLSVVSIVSRLDVSESTHAEDLRSTREKASKRLTDHQASLMSQAPLGDSVVRKYSVLSARESVMEQTVSMNVSKWGKEWIATVWLDNARDLGEGIDGPWTPAAGSAHWKTSIRPIFLHPPYLPLVRLKQCCQPTRQPSGSSKWHANQNACLLPFGYGNFLDKETMRRDALYALSEIFRFCAQSESQFLDAIRLQIDRDSHATAFTKTSEHALENIRYLKQLLDRHLSEIKMVAGLLANRSLLDWPMADRETFQEGHELAEKERNLLKLDFEQLQERIEILSLTCQQEIQSLSDQSVFQASMKGLENAARVEKLTVLATIFIPLSFTCGIYGMNFKEFGTGTLSIWVFVVTVVVVLGVASFAYFFRVPSLTKR